MGLFSAESGDLPALKQLLEEIDSEFLNSSYFQLHQTDWKNVLANVFLSINFVHIAMKQAKAPWEKARD